jgi:cell division protein YceG involved in septum cleavage
VAPDPLAPVEPTPHEPLLVEYVPVDPPPGEYVPADPSPPSVYVSADPSLPGEYVPADPSPPVEYVQADPPTPGEYAQPPELPGSVHLKRGRSPLARVAAVLALVAVIAALVALLHSSSPKHVAPPAPPPVVKVLIPEGKTRAQIAEIAATDGLKGDYRVASRRSPLLNPAAYGAPHGTPDLEGFLFPATYDMDKGAPVSRLVEEQLAAFQENVGVSQIARAHALHVTPYQLLTVASMVEREAQIPGDRPKIAAVIYNRLAAGMPLGIDASIYYAVELATGVATYTHELTEAQLHIDSPYNTRTHVGLPPTPISNPGVASIEAAAHPAHVSYLYYVAGADGCGEQVFSHTLAEFEVDAAAYKAAVARAGGHPPTCKHTLTGTPPGAQAGK